MRIIQSQIANMDEELDTLNEGLNSEKNSAKDLQEILDQTSAYSYESWQAIMDKFFAKQREEAEKEQKSLPADELDQDGEEQEHDQVFEEEDENGSPKYEHTIYDSDDFESSEIDWDYSDLDLDDIRNEKNGLPHNGQMQRRNGEVDADEVNKNDDALTYGGLQYELFKTLDSLYKMSAYGFGLAQPKNGKADAEVINVGIQEDDESKVPEDQE